MIAQEQVNILLVDDQPAKLMSYEVILAELGENLIKANSAREALEFLLKNDVAVVLVEDPAPTDTYDHRCDHLGKKEDREKSATSRNPDSRQ